MEKILTISIAAYNIEKYIQATVGSLLHDQIIDKIEILIISDGSTDKTVKIGKEYQEQYPQTVRVIEKENGGWGSTVNTAIEEARGKYFKLLDGDDLYITENLPRFIEYLEQNDFDLVLTPYCEFIDETGKIKRHIEHGSFAKEFHSINDIPKGTYLEMHECCFKTVILKKEKVHLIEHCFYTDSEFVVKGISAVESVGFLNQVIYKYRVNSSEQSVSIAGFRKHYKEHLKVLYTLLEFEKKYSGNENIRQVMREIVRTGVIVQYNMFCLLEGSKKQKNELIEFDRRLKNDYYDYYDVPMKKVVVLRKSRFWFYSYVVKYYMRKVVLDK